MQGDLGKLKPADVLAAGNQVLRGFKSESNSAFAAKNTAWRTELEQARDMLANALGGKYTAKSGTRESNGSLASARAHFVHLYNRVAKHMVRGYLASLGREQEYRQFFLDLQVNERGNRPAANSGEPPTGDQGTDTNAPAAAAS